MVSIKKWYQLKNGSIKFLPSSNMLASALVNENCDNCDIIVVLDDNKLSKTPPVSQQTQNVVFMEPTQLN